MVLSDRYRSALVYAFDAHREQERKGSGVPYVAHLLGVSSLVLEYGGNEDCAIGGLLHDVAEDQGSVARLEEVEALFGATVAQIVRECTDSLEVPRPPWRERKVRYLKQVGRNSSNGQLVSLCDKIYNARTIVADYRLNGDDLWRRFAGGRDGVLWYYQALAESYTVQHPAVTEFYRVVCELVDLVGTQEIS